MSFWGWLHLSCLIVTLGLAFDLAAGGPETMMDGVWRYIAMATLTVWTHYRWTMED